MGSIYGKIFQISTFGESHGAAVGVIIQGCPAGVDFDLNFIQSELDRRKPGQSRITTQRKEADTVEVLSGIFEGKTTGTPIAMLVWNGDQRSKDYSHIADQNFVGFAKESEARFGKIWREAVLRTVVDTSTGLAILSKGKPIQAYFFSSSSLD